MLGSGLVGPPRSLLHLFVDTPSHGMLERPSRAANAAQSNMSSIFGRRMSDGCETIAILPRTLGLLGEPEVAKREMLVMRVGSRLIGVFADEADFVVRWKEPTPLPRAPRAVLGVVAVRGRIYTVLDPRVLLTLEDGSTNVLIVTLRGEEQLALAAERVEGVIEVAEQRLQSFGRGDALIHGAVEHAGELIAVLDCARLFAAAIDEKVSR